MLLLLRKKKRQGAAPGPAGRRGRPVCPFSRPAPPGAPKFKGEFPRAAAAGSERGQARPQATRSLPSLPVGAGSLERSALLPAPGALSSVRRSAGREGGREGGGGTRRYAGAPRPPHSRTCLTSFRRAMPSVGSLSQNGLSRSLVRAVQQGNPTAAALAPLQWRLIL